MSFHLFLFLGTPSCIDSPQDAPESPKIISHRQLLYLDVTNWTMTKKSKQDKAGLSNPDTAHRLVFELLANLIDFSLKISKCGFLLPRAGTSVWSLLETLSSGLVLCLWCFDYRACFSIKTLISSTWLLNIYSLRLLSPWPAQEHCPLRAVGLTDIPQPGDKENKHHNGSHLSEAVDTPRLAAWWSWLEWTSSTG